MTLSPAEAVVILTILLVLFGGSRIPKLGRAIGQSVRELRSRGDHD